MPLHEEEDTDNSHLGGAALDNGQGSADAEKDESPYVTRDSGVPVPSPATPCHDLSSKHGQRDCQSADCLCHSPPKRERSQECDEESEESPRTCVTKRNAEASETQADVVPLTEDAIETMTAATWVGADARWQGLDTTFTSGQGRGSSWSVASGWPRVQPDCGGQHDRSACLPPASSWVDAFPGEDEVSRLLRGLRHVEESSLVSTLADIVMQPETLRAVLGRAVNPDTLYRAHTGRTCSLLHTAVAQGRLASVRVLVEEAGASVDLEGRGGETPLKVACRLGRRDVARFLLARGADPDHQLCSRSLGEPSSHCRDTPLMKACRHGNQGIVRLLLDAGCDVALANSHGNNALHVACEFWNLNLVRALGKHFPTVDTPNNKGETPLYMVLSKIGLPHRKHISRCIQMAYELVLAGAKINAKTTRQDSPLKVLTEKLPYVLLESKPGSDKFFTSRIAFLLDSSALDEETRRLLRKALTAIATKCKSRAAPGGDTAGDWRADRLSTLTLMLQTVVQEPSSLQHLCFTTVRQHLRGSLKRARYRLPLPALLQKYVCLPDYVDPGASLIGPRAQTSARTCGAASRSWTS